MSSSARQAKDNQYRTVKGLSVNQLDWQRKSAYDFTGCLSHIDLTYRPANNLVLRITGIVSHNEMCLRKVMKRLPAVPLHNHVWQVALQQLDDGAR
jgi:hypothetical protein